MASVPAPAPAPLPPSVCPPVYHTGSNGVYSNDPPLAATVNLLIVQILIIVFLSRVVHFVLRPAKQPRVVAEIIAGVLLGPSALGKITWFRTTFFPPCSLAILATFANIGLIYFMFLLGLELDMTKLLKTGHKSLTIAGSGIVATFALSVPVSYAFFHITGAVTIPFYKFAMFMGVAMAITAFPVLARILAERKLLVLPLGQIAITAAAVGDLFAWILLALTLALLRANNSPIIALWSFLSAIAVCLFAYVTLSPLYKRWSRSDVEDISEIKVTITLMLVLIFAFLTDIIGVHAIFGGFLVGVMIPHQGQFAVSLTKKIEDFVVIVMLPLYFAASGLKTNIFSISGWSSIGLLALVIVTVCIGKIFGTAFPSHYFLKLDWRESFTLGFLMNTKGLVEIIVLNIGLSSGAINVEIFTIMVLMALFTTFMTTPLVLLVYQPARDNFVAARAAEELEGVLPPAGAPEDESNTPCLRMLVAVYGMPAVAPMATLSDMVAGRSAKDSEVLFLRLMELSERPSAIMQMQGRMRDIFLRRDAVIFAFRQYADFFKIQTKAFVAVSQPSHMYEDVVSVAAANGANLVVLPYLEPDTGSNDMLENFRTGYNNSLSTVVRNSKSSVGILVSRGLGTNSTSSATDNGGRKVLVIFIGGADDREALCLGARMGERKRTTVKILRFLPENYVCMDVEAANLPLQLPRTSSSSDPSNSASHSQPPIIDEATKAVEMERDQTALGLIASQTEMDLAAGRKPRVVVETISTNAMLAAILSTAQKEESTLIIVGRQSVPSVEQWLVNLASDGARGDVLTPHGHHHRASLSFTGLPALQLTNLQREAEDTLLLGPLGCALMNEASISASILVVGDPRSGGDIHYDIQSNFFSKHGAINNQEIVLTATSNKKLAAYDLTHKKDTKSSEGSLSTPDVELSDLPQDIPRSNNTLEE